MLSRDFKDIPSLKEVECWGANLNPDVKLLSLKLYQVTDNSVLASLNVITNSCVTFGDFSSCAIDTVDTHKSRLRVLVADLQEGETRHFGCKANTLKPLGDSETLTWTLSVTRKSECWRQTSVLSRFTFEVFFSG